MFSLTKREQRVIIVTTLALVAIALAKHYHDVGTIVPAQAPPAPATSATPSSLPDEERAIPDNGR